MSQEKTEKPSPRRQREAREKGQILRSQELVSALIVLGAGLMVLAFGGLLFDALAEIFAVFHPAVISRPPPWPEVLGGLMDQAGLIILPILACTGTVAIAGNLLTGGWVFAPGQLVPKLENLDPIKGLGKVVSVKNMVEFLLSVLKIVLFTITGWLVIRSHLETLFRLPDCGLSCIAPLWKQMGLELMGWFGGLWLGFAAIDVLVQRQHLNKSLRMSHQEVRRDFREDEGSPELKQTRKSLQMEMQAEQGQGSIDDATAVVVNPSHVFVALYYETGKTDLPLITAMEQGPLAARLKKYAREKEVPVMENVRLARQLLAKGRVGRPIPRELMRPVAGVIRWARQMRKKQAEEEQT